MGGRRLVRAACGSWVPALLLLSACGSPADDGAGLDGGASVAGAPELRQYEPPSGPPATRYDPAPAGGWQVGDTVLGSPAGMESYWVRCVITAPHEVNTSPAQCADEYVGNNGGMTLTVQEVHLRDEWTIPDDPAYRPHLQIDAARAEVEAYSAAANAPPPPPPADGDAGGVAQGDYECWANGYANLTLNFTVTGKGRYRASDGSSGRFDFDAGTGAISFTDYLRDAMPDGYTSRYHEPGGRPTVSFVSDRGSEAAFCELA